MKICRLVWCEWRKACESRNPEDPAYQKMTTAKRVLRKEQGLDAVKQRNAREEDIMSSGNDLRLF